MLELTIVLAVALLIVWFCSEFQGKRWVRIALGTAAIAVAYLIATAVGMLQQLNYNAWYSDASTKLIDATLSELEAQHVSNVVSSLEWLQSRYHANYETGLVDYQRFVEEYVERFAEKSESLCDRVPFEW